MDYEIVVAGGGIAGLTAGLTAARLGRKTLVLSGEMLGGLLLSIERIEGYPGFPEGIAGYELCPIAQEQAADAGAEFAATELRAIEPDGPGWRIGTGEGDQVSASALILATGASLRELGVPGEQRLRGKGVSHCASCDGPLMRDRVVCVVGGGDSAAQEALTLAKFASRVILIHRGKRLAIQKTFADRIAAEPKIEVHFGAVVTEIHGDTVVSGVRVTEGSGEAVDIDAAAIFVYVGLEPNSAFANGRVARDPAGRILTDGSMRTELPGLYAAGALRSGWAGRAAVSASDGATAAVAADQDLRTALGGTDG